MYQTQVQIGQKSGILSFNEILKQLKRILTHRTLESEGNLQLAIPLSQLRQKPQKTARRGAGTGGILSKTIRIKDRFAKVLFTVTETLKSAD